jgi:hypothetical protein
VGAVRWIGYEGRGTYEDEKGWSDWCKNELLVVEYDDLDESDGRGRYLFSLIEY